MIAGRVVAGRAVRLACARHLRDLDEGPARGLRWDRDAAQHALDFFPRFLRLAEGEHAGKPFTLQPWQQFIVGSLFGWKAPDGFRRFRTAYIEVGKGSGKAVALDTPIPTPDGWTTMGALRVGDRVFDERGAVCVVTATSAVMTGRPCYRVAFADGAAIIADAEHLWRTTALRSAGRRGPKPPGQPRKGQPSLRTTAEIARTVMLPASASRHPQAKYNHRIDVAGVLALPEAALPIPPYTLGAWLGDGEAQAARLTAPPGKRQILHEIEGEGVAVEVREAEQRALLGRGWFQVALRELGVLGAKHIPSRYLRASAAQRMALLQGLMDTDGYCPREGQCEFTTTTPALAAGALELLHTLGFKATMTEGRALLEGRDCGPKWRIRFQAYADEPVFRLGRKVERLRRRPKSRPLSSGRMIVACEPVPSEPVRCIRVSAPSGLFLASRAMIPTHNSPMAAGLGLYGLIFDDEPSAEVYAAAVTRDQAKIVFADAKKMAEASPLLMQRLNVTENNIAYEAEGSFFRPISSEKRGLDGKRVHIAIIDELHEHPTPVVADKMRLGTKGRRQALIVEITNAGYDRQSVCYQHHELGLRILDQVVDNDAVFVYLCQLDPCDACRAKGQTQPQDGCSACDAITDERVWVKTNPNLDVSVTRRYLREVVAEAAQKPATRNIVKRLNFCIWTESVTRWLQADDWAQGNAAVDAAALRGRRCFLGIDLSSTTDLTAVVALFPDADGASAVLPFFWLPEDNMRARVERDRVPYDLWAREGLLTLTPGNVIDYDFIRTFLVETFAPQYAVAEVGYDPYNATQFVLALQADGLTVVPVRQGFLSLSAPTKELGKLVREGALRHGGHPILAWNAANAVVREDPAGNVKLDKVKATERIDGVAALVNALARALVAPPPPPPPSIVSLAEFGA